MASAKKLEIFGASSEVFTRGYDILGNIAIVKFRRGINLNEKKKFAKGLMSKHSSVETVLEKTEKFKGRLRTLKTKHILGEKTKEVLYRENDCIFRFNVDTCYFSPRLSSERKEIAESVKKVESVLVMFGGVAPYAIVIAKKAKPKKVISVELGRECNKYAVENVKRNKVNVELIQGDVRKKAPLLKDKFDRIVMARPNLEDSFLDVAFKKLKKNGIIHYYGFYKIGEVDKLRDLIFREAKKGKKKTRILKIKQAGDIGPYRYRYRADIKILN